MSDKAPSQTIDDFFDVRSLAAVLLGFTFVEWMKVLIALAVGTNPMTLAIVWPIIFLLFVIVLANAGRKTNHDLKRQEFEERVEELMERLDENNDNE